MRETRRGGETEVVPRSPVGGSDVVVEQQVALDRLLHESEGVPAGGSERDLTAGLLGVLVVPEDVIQGHARERRRHEMETADEPRDVVRVGPEGDRLERVGERRLRRWSEFPL